MIHLTAKPGPNWQETPWGPCLPHSERKLQSSAAQKYRSSWAPCPLPRGSGGENIRDVHSVTCLKSKKLWNTFSPQGLDKGWEHRVSSDPKNPPTMKCPSRSQGPQNNSQSKPNQQRQKLNDKRTGHLKNWWMVGEKKKKSSLLCCQENSWQCYHIRIWHHPLSSPG